MAKGKKASKPAPTVIKSDIVADPTTYAPVINTAAPEAVADAAPVVEEIICPPNMGIVNRALEEAGQRPQVPNLIGNGIDMDAVIAKHLQASAPGAPGSSKVSVSRSSVVHPVKLVHVIASEMYEKNPETQRKDVIAACEAAGIATHTARTQYQIWHQAMKSDRATKAALAAAPPRVPLAVARGNAVEKPIQRKPRK